MRRPNLFLVPIAGARFRRFLIGPCYDVRKRCEGDLVVASNLFSHLIQ